MGDDYWADQRYEDMKHALESGKIKPATPFMAGYSRSPEVTEQLVAAVRDALYALPTLRLGQLLSNVETYDLFNIHDEDIIKALRNYIEEKAK
jgi:hypothetical protein